MEKTDSSVPPRIGASGRRRASIHRLRRTALLVAGGVVLPLLAHARCQVQSFELPVKMVGSRAVATVGINGTSVPLTVDSGAFFSNLTDAAAAQLKLPIKPVYGMHVEGIAGRMETQMTTVDTLQLLGGNLPRIEFLVGGNEPGAGTMGLMGRNLLSFTDTEYDLAHGVIRFMMPNDDCADKNMAYWAGSTAVTELDLLARPRSATPPIRGKVRLNGVMVVALFDTGATTLVTRQAARRAGIGPESMTPAGIVYGVGEGRRNAWTADFATFEIGGETIRNNRLRVADFSIDDGEMLLGIDFFLSHRIYVSKSQSKMYLTYNGGTVFALNKGDVAVAPSLDAAPAASGVAASASADELARRGAASAARRDYESALADLDRACELDPASAAHVAQRGAVHVALRHPAKAIADFDKAIALDPSQPDAHFGRARLRLGAQDLDGALADLDALDATLPDQATLRLALARYYLDLVHPEKAMSQLDRWLASHPNDIERAVALEHRCRSRVMLGVDLAKALADCDDAVDREGKNAGFLGSRGWTYLRMGQDRKALSDFDRSLAVSPKWAWSLYGRGLAKKRLGETAQADADFEAARQVLPDIDVQVTRSRLVAGAAPGS